MRQWIKASCFVVLMCASVGFAQDAKKEINKAAQQDQKPVPQAVVIEVSGSVDHAKPGISVLADEGWTPVKLDDKFSPGTQIRTGLRSHVNFRFGETTIVSIRSATHASIDQFYRSATSENIRIGLGYGTIRGGSTKSTLHSDVIIDSPVATLAKRGTEGWQIWVEPATGRFNISLSQHGLVEAIQKNGSSQTRSRDVNPGEYATQNNIANMWIQQDIFDRNVNLYEANSTTQSDALFTAFNTGGFGSLAVGGGSELANFSGRLSAEFVLQQTNSNLPAGLNASNLAVLQLGPINRPEGNFGTGNTLRVLIPRR